mmetsp:Transcript_25422/g.75097  ORF Transcript_25422/g.75097 Transcript_25422/m.75097 type:complete len:342 (+) Transcript_25422:464-1489(+)
MHSYAQGGCTRQSSLIRSSQLHATTAAQASHCMPTFQQRRLAAAPHRHPSAARTFTVNRLLAALASASCSRRRPAARGFVGNQLFAAWPQATCSRLCRTPAARDFTVSQLFVTSSVSRRLEAWPSTICSWLRCQPATPGLAIDRLPRGPTLRGGGASSQLRRCSGATPLVCLHALRVLAVLLIVLVAAHVVVGRMDPLCHRPLFPGKNGARAMHAALLQLPLGVHRVEQNRVALFGLDRQVVFRTVGEERVHAARRRDLGEHCLAAVVRRLEVHEHCRVPVTAVLSVDRVEKVVPVRVVLLLLLVPQHLEALAVPSRRQRPLTQAPLDALQHRVLSAREEH